MTYLPSGTTIKDTDLQHPHLYTPLGCPEILSRMLVGGGLCSLQKLLKGPKRAAMMTVSCEGYLHMTG